MSTSIVFAHNIVSFLMITFFYFRVQLYIDNGWNKTRLKDPDGGIHVKTALERRMSPEEQEIKNFLESPPSPTDQKWTQLTSGLPLDKITHSGVEKFFEQSGDQKHIKEVYTFSKTLKFETSGKPMRIFMLNENYFLLEGYTRPSMKSSIGISKGAGLYHCNILYSLKTGEILRAMDRNCPAGKRGLCKHVAALAYKFVECAMGKKDALPRVLSCTEIKRQWGLPSLRAEQDPE